MVKYLKDNKSILIGAGAIMLAALLWSLDGVFIRPKFYILPASLVVFLEHALGFIILSPFIILSWSKIKLLRPKDWGAVLWVSIFGGLLGTIMITKAFFAAIDGEVTFATVVILQKLQPIFALIMARLVLGERLSKRFYGWAGLAIVAAYFLAFGKTGLNIFEIDWVASAAWFAFIAAFAFGSSTVFGKKILNHLDFKAATALRFGITSVLALGLVFLTKDLFKITELNAVHWQLLGVIVFTSGAGALFIYYYGLKRVTASTATICELFWPLSAVVLDYVLNKNILNSLQIIASIVLLVAFYKVVKEGKTKNIEFTAKVVPGLGRGIRLGAPTINLDKIDLNINYGVYLVEAEIGQKKYKGLMHFGTKDTFGEKVSTELYIKEKVTLDINEKISVTVNKKIRNIIKFKTVEELKEQIRKDVQSLL